MKLPNNQDLVNILQKTLNRVDSRLVDHGERVAYLVYKMLQPQKDCFLQELRDDVIVALLHDVGAYKTEEINRMVQFETGGVWEHSVYGYLFLHSLPPLQELAPGILYHHTPYCKLRGLDTEQKELAQLINLADRMDVLTQVEHRLISPDFWERTKGSQFSPWVIEQMQRISQQFDLPRLMESGQYKKELTELLVQVPFTREEIDAYLHMIAFAIDFRSHHTVTHTITTESVSVEIATLLGLPAQEITLIRYGALLHDLGKIAIPVEILEFPGKLSPQAMAVMRTHVEITGEILGEQIDPEIAQIALRHHEKLDGSGYPRGLTGEELSPAQRVLAVADIVSALYGTRSYKAAFSKERIVSILQEMKTEGKLCPQVVDLTCKHYDQIMKNVEDNCKTVLVMYNHIQTAYESLLTQCERL